MVCGLSAWEISQSMGTYSRIILDAKKIWMQVLLLNILGNIFSCREKKRERGNEVFGRNDYAGAINSYNK